MSSPSLRANFSAHPGSTCWLLAYRVQTQFFSFKAYSVPSVTFTASVSSILQIFPTFLSVTFIMYSSSFRNMLTNLNFRTSQQKNLTWRQSFYSGPKFFYKIAVLYNFSTKNSSVCATRGRLNLKAEVVLSEENALNCPRRHL